MPEWVRLITTKGDVERTQIESLLRSEKIQCVVVNKDNSDALRIYMGGSHALADVLVRDRELARARELLKAFEYTFEE